jgi:hypothetical protein
MEVEKEMIILSSLIKHEMSIFEAYEAIKKIKTLKIFTVEFEGLYPVGNCLILSAYTISQAQEMAKKIINHTDDIIVKEVIIEEPKVIKYLSGDY